MYKRQKFRRAQLQDLNREGALRLRHHAGELDRAGGRGDGKSFAAQPVRDRLEIGLQRTVFLIELARFQELAILRRLRILHVCEETIEFRLVAQLQMNLHPEWLRSVEVADRNPTLGLERMVSCYARGRIGATGRHRHADQRDQNRERECEPPHVQSPPQRRSNGAIAAAVRRLSLIHI